VKNETDKCQQCSFVVVAHCSELNVKFIIIGSHQSRLLSPCQSTGITALNHRGQSQLFTHIKSNNCFRQIFSINVRAITTVKLDWARKVLSLSFTQILNSHLTIYLLRILNFIIVDYDRENVARLITCCLNLTAKLYENRVRERENRNYHRFCSQLSLGCESFCLMIFLKLLKSAQLWMIFVFYNESIVIHDVTIMWFWTTIMVNYKILMTT
jgi:hypothetical protein